MSRRPLTVDDVRALTASVAAEAVTSDLVLRVHPGNAGFYDLPTGANKKPTPKRARNFDRAFAAAVERGRAVLARKTIVGDAADLVGLYAVLHEHVFGVLPLELKADYGAACSSANKLVRDEFGGNFEAAERFMAWCWGRVRHSVKRKRADGDEPFRPGWRLQFKSRSWVTDFKASQPGKLR